MEELDYLAFLLQNMTRAELIENLYLSADDGSIDAENIPSDNESSVGEDMNDDNLEDNCDNVPVLNIFSDTASDTEEEIIPLKDLQARLPSEKHILQRRESLSDQPVWTKDNSPFENTTSFTSASGVSDFIKHQIDLLSPAIQGSLRQNTSQHIAPEEDVHCAAQVKDRYEQIGCIKHVQSALYGKR
ncbi:hypothetical protein JTB14_005568 [Gonioctena quinquepunctata]|nr:hypothetical protein JTB14_005568 [Gonioctena quinquepunctata]